MGLGWRVVRVVLLRWLWQGGVLVRALASEALAWRQMPGCEAIMSAQH